MKKIYASAAALTLSLSLTAAAHPQSQGQGAQTPHCPCPAAQTGATEDEIAVALFEKRVRDYVRMREDIEGKMPKLPTAATAEQIEAHRAAFREKVRAARAGAEPGRIFTPRAAELIRAIISKEFTGRDRAELRRSVFEAENEGVQVRVNHPYPASEERMEMPPNLLLALPQLPKQLKYRFVGPNLLLVDRENTLIIDFMPHALP